MKMDDKLIMNAEVSRSFYCRMKVLSSRMGVSIFNMIAIAIELLEKVEEQDRHGKDILFVDKNPTEK